MKRGSLLFSTALCLILVGLAACGFAAEGGEGAHHVDGTAQLKDFGWRVLDFSVLFAILFWALKKADVKGNLAERRRGIERSLDEARAARDSAERKLAEYSDKLARANQELEALQATMKQEALAEKERIIAEAQVAAGKIRAQAQMAADQEVLKARSELREEAARLAVQLAEKAIREKIGKDDQDRLVGEYLSKVVGLP